VRNAYLIAGIVVSIFVMANGPRLPWIESMAFGPIGIFRGFTDGMIGFSYVVTWILLIGGFYQLWLGVLYWDMDSTEGERWQYILRTGGTARVLWIVGGLCLIFGIMYAWYVYSNDHRVWPAGMASTVVSWAACWLFWLAFPLYEQVGIDRDELGI
jgi:hypothetical protein